MTGVCLLSDMKPNPDNGQAAFMVKNNFIIRRMLAHVFRIFFGVLVDLDSNVRQTKI